MGMPIHVTNVKTKRKIFLPETYVYYHPIRLEALVSYKKWMGEHIECFNVYQVHSKIKDIDGTFVRVVSSIPGDYTETYRIVFEQADNLEVMKAIYASRFRCEK